MTPRGTGLFGGFDLEDGKSLIILSTALNYWRAGGRDPESSELKGLSKLQSSMIEMSSQRMNKSPLLRDIINPFLSLPKDWRLLASGRDIELYATCEAYEPKALAYQDAEKAWNNKQPLRNPDHTLLNHASNVGRTFAEAKDLRKRGYGPKATRGIEDDDSEDTDTGSESDTIMSASKMLKANETSRHTYSNGKQTRNSKLAASQTSAEIERDRKIAMAYGQQEAKKYKYLQSQGIIDPMNKQGKQNPSTTSARISFESSSVQKARSGAGKANSSSREVLDGLLASQLQRDEYGEASFGDGSVTSNVWEPMKKKPNHIVINKDKIDRRPAVQGVVDASKLEITLETSKPDPDNPDQTIPGTESKARYRYSKPFADINWDSKKAIYDINQWRQQIFGRRLDRVRKSRESWLVSEKNLLMTLIEEQLRRQGKPKWNRIANAFNRQNAMAGVTQDANEPLIQQGSRKINALGEDRTAPWRSRLAIQAMCKRTPEIDRLIGQGKALYCEEHPLESKHNTSGNADDSDSSTSIDVSVDSEEIKDPNPGPPPPGPRKQTELRKTGRSGKEPFPTKSKGDVEKKEIVVTNDESNGVKADGESSELSEKSEEESEEEA